MRSEAEIRREVETRLRRRGLLIVDGGFWLLAGFALYEYARYADVAQGYVEPIVLLMLFWGALLGLHLLAVLYVELREYFVRRAIEHERQFYEMQDAYEKRKRDDALPRLTDDGELIDFIDQPEQKVKRN